MALKKCKECGHEVSEQAGTCPNCGHPLKEREIRFGMIVVATLALFNLLCLLVTCNKSDKEADTVSKTEPPTLVQSTPFPTPSEPELLDYVVNTKTLTVRKEPNENSPIAMTRKKGESVYGEGYKEEKVWLKVHEFMDGGREGYAKTSDLTLRDAIPSNAVSYVKIVSFTWTADYGVAKFNIKVKNTSNWGIKDIQFTITYMTPSGTIIDEGKETAYELIPAGETETVQVQELTNSQSRRASIRIIDAKWYWQKGERHLDW